MITWANLRASAAPWVVLPALVFSGLYITANLTDSESCRKVAGIVAERWQEFLGFGTDVIDSAMVRAAYEQQRLRVLLPGVSHGILHLSRCTGTKDDL
ncbi:DUF6193 family natural product biosynthesis protein [Streptomyces sp. NPDC097617]|uniref:DUF6193 family natural product biosynthesis protein n=1 Tax=Streptomyces sp. NPDC097617 TaxID=3366091 RepID=UPI0037FD5AA1